MYHTYHNLHLPCYQVSTSRLWLSYCRFRLKELRWSLSDEPIRVSARNTYQPQTPTHKVYEVKTYRKLMESFAIDWIFPKFWEIWLKKPCKGSPCVFASLALVEHHELWFSYHDWLLQKNTSTGSTGSKNSMLKKTSQSWTQFAPENLPSQKRKLICKTSFFRGHVQFWGCIP